MPEVKIEKLENALSKLAITPKKKSKETSAKETPADKVKEEVKPEAKNLTPYQGKRRSLGWFYCKDCKSSWSSAASWANTYQKCQKCNRKVYPFRQAKLEYGGPHPRGKAGGSAHPTKLCGKCIDSGTKCF